MKSLFRDQLWEIIKKITTADLARPTYRRDNRAKKEVSSIANCFRLLLKSPGALTRKYNQLEDEL